MGFGNDFLDTIPKAQAIKLEINKWDFMKIKKLCIRKDNINTIKRKPTE